MLAEYVQRKGFLIADILTACRGLIALYLAIILWQGRTVLDTFMMLIFAAWLTDCLDGYLARKSCRPGNLARLDGWVDWAIYIITLRYGTLLGHYSKEFFAIFVGLNILIFWLSKSIYVNQTFQFLYILLGFRAVWFESNFWRRFFVLWVAGVIFFQRKRLAVQIRHFLSGWSDLFAHRKSN